MTKEQREHAGTLLRLAVCVQMTLPGVPCILYGDEAGLEGYIDPFCRAPFPWGDEDMEITALYRAFGKLRREESIFRCGGFVLSYVDSEILCFERHGEREMLAVTVNRSRETYEFHAPLAVSELMTGTCAQTIEIAPESFAVVKLPKDTDYGVFVKIERDGKKT